MTPIGCPVGAEQFLMDRMRESLLRASRAYGHLLMAVARANVLDAQADAVALSDLNANAESVIGAAMDALDSMGDD